MSDPRLREPFFRLSEPTSWPRGVECALDYDGYVLNDRRRLDRIVVESIGGLTGPDLAAEAEKNPDRDGETPYDATYGGWTITLRGYVEAGTLETMRSLYSYVLDAFDDVSEERALWFRWLDWRDFFVDSNALVDYVYDAGSGTLSIASDGSGLQPSSTAAKSIVLRPKTIDGSIISRYTYGDGEAIVRFRSTTLTGLVVGPVFRRTAATQMLKVSYSKALDQLIVQKVVAGTPTTLKAAPVPALTSDSSYWIRSRVEGAVVTFSLWSTYPPDLGGTPIAEGSHELSSGDQAIFPASASGLDWGLHWTPAATTDRVEMIDVGAVNKGDAILMCRKATQVEGDETQVDDRFRRTFAVALRNSSARMTSRKPSVIVSYPTDFTLTFPVDGSGLTFPANGSGLIFGGYLSDDVVNLGRSPARPVVRIYGPMTGPVLFNPGDDKMIGVDGSVAFGDYYEFDHDKHTVVDSSGASVYRNINDDTNWFELQPGTNSIIIGADSIVGDDVPATAIVVAATDVFTLAAHGMVDGQVIVVESISGATPISDEQSVFVRDSTTNTFKVSEAKGSAALNVTVDGSVAIHVVVGHVEFLYRHSAR